MTEFSYIYIIFVLGGPRELELIVLHFSGPTDSERAFYWMVLV